MAIHARLGSTNRMWRFFSSSMLMNGQKVRLEFLMTRNLKKNNKNFDLETCHGNETVPRANLSGLEPQIVQNCAGME